MLGVCYYPEHWPEAWWREDARRMRALGIQYVRIGEFAWSRLEPRPGELDLGWLDRAMDVLHEAGLKIVLGTPTATPPKWLIDRHPDILAHDIDGRPRGFGSRRHYTFSSKTYRTETARIVGILAERYGTHPGLAGWQTDNEYGCHDTVMSYSPEDLKAFHDWLRRHYQTPEALNEAWGNVFWSMEVTHFDDVSLPNLTVTEANPAARMDFRRFQSSQVAAYDALQQEIIRKHSPGRFVTHNMMGFFTEYDHWKLGEHLDFPSWDSYPAGHSEQFPLTEEEHRRWALTAHPDTAPFNHDLYRGIGKGRFWVMEQQPGPVNWAPWNPVPKPDMVRLWTWEALAHGAEVVSYFRWRQVHFAQEQMHAGLNLPHSQELSPGGLEARQVGEELMKLGKLPESRQGDVALVYDYEAQWMHDIQPQARDFHYGELCFRFYEALRRLGLDVDVVRPGASLKGYKLVVVPSLPVVSNSARLAFEKSGAHILYGPRTGSKTTQYQIPPGLPPGELADLLNMHVLEVSSLRPGVEVIVKGAVNGMATRWAEHLNTKAKVLARYEDGGAALIAHGRHTYLGFWPDVRLLGALVARLAKQAGLKTVSLPEHVRLRRRGDLVFAFNYGPKAWTLPAKVKPLLGAKRLAGQSVAIWKAQASR